MADPTKPRLEFDAGFGPKEDLSGAAGFSGRTGSRGVFVSEVVHEGFAAVDEDGAEATAVIMLTWAMPQEPLEVTVDVSFVFLIGDGGTGTVLFVRRVPDPRA